MSAFTPNAKNHAGLDQLASRAVRVPELPWEKTKFPGVETKTLTFVWRPDGSRILPGRRTAD
jgi:hypothetical protein